MNARDTIAHLLFTTDNKNAPDVEAEWRAAGGKQLIYIYAMADALIAAGYRKPRTITTLEELDALPIMSIVLDRLDICYRLYRDPAYSEPVWCVVGETVPSSPHGWLPATVLYKPEPAS